MFSLNLTPNRRMAAFLQSKGIANVMPVTVWLEQLYADLCYKNPGVWPDYLSSYEAEIIWNDIIEHSEAGQRLLRTASAARLAREAWALSVQWRIGSIAEEAHTEDSRTYAAWASHYQTLCHHKRWVDFATSVDLLIEAVEAAALQNAPRVLDLPPEIILTGFEELTPQLTVFLDTLKTRLGIKVTTRSLLFASTSAYGETLPEVCRLPLQNSETELRAAVVMATQWLSEKPESRIGIVVPDLERQRNTVVRICQERLAPLSFNIAAPLPLASYPLIEAGLLSLGLVLGEIPLETFSKWLRSPFLGGSITEEMPRALFDVMVRQWGEPSFTVRALLKRHSREPNKNVWVKELNCMQRLQQALEYYSTHTDSRSASGWKEVWIELLKILGWPGERPCNLEEEQIHTQWNSLLESYGGLDRCLGPHTYADGLTHLTKLARETSFLPYAPKCSIQILGVLEAVGIPFDALWVTGMHREAWPLSPAPNPLIPLAMQRAKDVPRSVAARELKIAKQLTERLCQGAPRVVFSYPLFVDEQALSVSALVAHIREVTPEAMGLSTLSSPLERVGEIKPYVSALKERAPAVLKDEILRGGTRILSLQAACPFRAFAEIRLKALPLPEAYGLTSRDRGQIVHEVLKLFWTGIADQNQLIALSDETIAQNLHRAFDIALKKWSSTRLNPLKPQYVALEKKRTCALVLQLIELEKRRSYFSVAATEVEQVVHFKGITLHIRIDRIDRLADKTEALIDYKTGQNSIRAWFGERPDEPQLPFYCITRSPPPAAIVLIILHPSGVQFKGLTQTADTLPSGVKTAPQAGSLGSESSFEAQCLTWKSTLSGLVDAFLEGVADVDPKEGAKTCRTCSLKLLCRVGV